LSITVIETIDCVKHYHEIFNRLERKSGWYDYGILIEMSIMYELLVVL